MKIVRLALIGFGNVGQGFAQLLVGEGKRLRQQYGLDFRIVAVCDRTKGSLHCSSGLDAQALLETVRQAGDFSGLSQDKTTWDALQTIQNAPCEAVLELSDTNLQTGEPAFTHIAQALRLGKHVVTPNKGPVALMYPQLVRLAKENACQLGVEGAVMSGTPAIHLGLDLLRAAGIRRVEGILNGTSNFILTQMEAGLEYAAALRQAQELGYAEADPRGDVEGHDAAAKLAILSAVLFGEALSLEKIQRQGITALSQADLASAARRSERWKLVASLERRGETLQAQVAPVSLPVSHPLAGVSGATNALVYTTDLLGPVTLIGPGAGRLETAYALLTDLLAIFTAGST